MEDGTLQFIQYFNVAEDDPVLSTLVGQKQGPGALKGGMFNRPNF